MEAGFAKEREQKMGVKLSIEWQELLRQRGMTIYRLAQETGITYRSLRYMINEDSPMLNLELAAQVLLALDVPLTFPFGITEENPDDNRFTERGSPPKD